MTNIMEHVGDLMAVSFEQQRIIDELKAELAALRPFAEVGKKALKREWYLQDSSSMCAYCLVLFGEHDETCPIPALLAQLETPDATR